MTKKDFITLADHIRDNRDQFPPSAVESLAAWLTTNYPRFKRQRWISYIDGECGPNGGQKGGA